MFGYLRATGTPGTEEWWIPLTERLQCLSTDVSHALLLVAPECIAVFRDRSGRYGYFDSHSRTAAGLPHPTGHGTAVMLTFTHLSDMADRVLKIFQGRGDETSYEFMPVSFETEQQSVQLPSTSVCEQKTRCETLDLTQKKKNAIQERCKMEKTVNSLPRPRSEAQLLQVKLKRHVKFKGYHQQFQTVNMHNVLAALSNMKAMHSEYRDISIRETAVFESPLDEEADVSESHLDKEADVSESHLDKEADVSEKQQEVDVAEQDEQHVEEKDEIRPGLTLDTCMQPPDIGQEILSYGEGIFSIAPAQGHKPVGFFKIPKLEAMAFPVQFPTGQNSIDEER
ncbi:hypothetical protein PO909_029849 [Leuciscus waleckii]